MDIKRAVTSVLSLGLLIFILNFLFMPSEPSRSDASIRASAREQELQRQIDDINRQACANDPSLAQCQ